MGHQKTLGDDPLVSRLLKGIFQKKPPASRSNRATWDASSVLTTLRDWGTPDKLNYAKLSMKVVTLVALFSARRVSDLVLLRTTKEHLQVSDEKVTMFCDFGAKQDRPGHVNPPIVLRAYEDKRLCPVAHIKAYIKITEKKRRGKQNGSHFFLTKVFPFGPAKLFTLRSWIVEVLKESGIAASAGSTRAAAATYASVSRISLARIMEAADWSRVSTIHRHYVRILPASVLERIRLEADTVQSALLTPFQA